MTLATWLLIAAIAAGITGAVLVAWRLNRVAWPAAPDWTWRNIMALIALAMTILGAAVLTLLAWWLLDRFGEDADRLIAELVRDKQANEAVGTVLKIIYQAMAWGLKLLLAGVLVVLLSLGLVITPRKVVINYKGAELSGGDTDTAVAAARSTADAADKRADQIAEKAAAQAGHADELPRPPK